MKAVVKYEQNQKTLGMFSWRGNSGGKRREVNVSRQAHYVRGEKEAGCMQQMVWSGMDPMKETPVKLEAKVCCAMCCSGAAQG